MVKIGNDGYPEIPSWEEMRAAHIKKYTPDDFIADSIAGDSDFKDWAYRDDRFTDIHVNDAIAKALINLFAETYSKTPDEIMEVPEIKRLLQDLRFGDGDPFVSRVVGAQSAFDPNNAHAHGYDIRAGDVPGVEPVDAPMTGGRYSRIEGTMPDGRQKSTEMVNDPEEMVRLTQGGMDIHDIASAPWGSKRHDQYRFDPDVQDFANRMVEAGIPRAHGLINTAYPDEYAEHQAKQAGNQGSGTEADPKPGSKADGSKDKKPEDQ